MEINIYLKRFMEQVIQNHKKNEDTKGNWRKIFISPKLFYWREFALRRDNTVN